MGKETEMNDEIFENMNGMLIHEMVMLSNHGNGGIFEQASKSPQEKMEFFLEKIKNGKSKVARACRDFVRAGIELDKKDFVFDELFRLLEICGEKWEVEEEFIYDIVEELINLYSSDAKVVPENQNENNFLAEIRHMKHIWDIMEKNIQGKLTEQETIELKENAESWNKDIEKLREMILDL